MVKKGQTGTEEPPSQKQRNKRNVECINCHRLGHYKSDCWAKGGDKEGRRPSRRNGSSNTDNRGGNGRNRDSDTHNNNNDNPSTDIEAWAATIIEIDEDTHGDIQQAAFATGDYNIHQPEVEIELYASGASTHMSPYRHRFINYRPIPPRAFTTANKRVFYAIGTGDIQIVVPNGDTTTPILLRDALYAPEVAHTIISIGRITNAGCLVTLEHRCCKIENKTGKTIGCIPASSNGLYKVEHK